MAKLLSVDGNYFLHRALSVVSKKRDPKFLEKNTLSMFVSFVANDAILHNATHVLVCFDAKRSFRNDIYKGYKANRIKSGDTTIVMDDGTEFTTDITPGSLVPKAKKIMGYAGLAVAHRKGFEADDLLGSIASYGSKSMKIVLDTRDKDLAATVNEYVTLYWPTEKRHIDETAVLKHFGVRPYQIRDLLCLLGDTVDNIPGVPGVGQKTAVKWLTEHGSISKALKNEKIKKQLEKHMSVLVMARKLVTLRTDLKFDVTEMIPNKIDPQLEEHIWSIPSALKDLADSRKLLKLKGLFS